MGRAGVFAVAGRGLLAVLAAMLAAALSGCSRSPLAQENESLRQECRRLGMSVAALKEQVGELAAHNRLLAAQRFLQLSPEMKNRLRLGMLDLLAEAPCGSPAMAQADLKEGRLNVLTGGMNAFTEEVKAHLKARYDIVVIDLATCTDGDDVFKMIDAYNDVVEPEFPRRFGKSLDQMLVEAGAFRK